MLLEFSDNVIESGSLIRSASPLVFHLFNLSLNSSYCVRFIVHSIYNTLCTEIWFKTRRIDFRESRIELLEGVYETTPTTHPFFHLEDSTVFENRKVYKVSDLLGEDIVSGRVSIEVDNACPGIYHQEYLSLPHKDHAVGISLGVNFGLLPKRNILTSLAAVKTRLAPPRIKETNPIITWVKAFIAKEMPKNNPRYVYIQEILLLLRGSAELRGITSTAVVEAYLKLLEDDEIVTIDVCCHFCSGKVLELTEQLHKYKWNTFGDIYDRHFKPHENDILHMVEPMTVSQVLKQASCSRIRAKYKKEVERRGLGESELDATFVMTIPEGSNADCIFTSNRAKTIPIFIKNEKYGLKDQQMTEEFLDLCHYNGIYPHSFDAELPRYSGYKPRIISAVPMGVPEEEVPGGQFLMCFYSASVKKAVAEILEKPRTVMNSVTMQEKQVIFHFVTNTRSTPVDQPRSSHLWRSLLKDNLKRECIGKTTTEVLRKAYESARLNRIINVLIHGDDSLMLYPIRGVEEPLFIECDYSAYDTSQADDAISTEHQFYSDWLVGLPQGFLERSASHHHMPFSFKGGKELAGADGDFLKFKIYLEEAMRLSGGWNTTIGNSLISAMIILYVIGSCRDRDLMVGERMFPLPIPRFNTYSDLRVKVKPEAFSYSFDPRHMSFLKMGIAGTPGGLTFVLLPSRCLRAFSLLTISKTALGPNKPMEDRLRTRVNEVLFETFHGYTVPTDFPILGALYRSIYWSVLSTKTVLALKQIANTKEDKFNEPKTILSNMKKGMSAVANLADLISPLSSHHDMQWLDRLVHDKHKLSEEKSYSPSSTYGGSFRTSRQDVIDMILTRYNGITSENGLIVWHPHILTHEHVEATEKKLMPINGLRTYHIEDILFRRMAEKDYSYSAGACVPSWF